jgi:hypothetical protein
MALSIQHPAQTRGPFGAAIFERGTGRLLAPQRQLVTSLNCSVFHAAMVGSMTTQSKIGDFDLGGPGRPPYELVVGTDLCAMFLGATLSGSASSTSCAAPATRTPERFGFDEGVKPAEWVAAPERRGITVERDILGDKAASVLWKYAGSRGEVYDAN